MKRITIWDMDFYHKKSFTPNPIAMKLSSYHKQNKHLINFVTKPYHITMSFDIFYIIKEKARTPKPPGHLLHDKRVKLIGKPFKFFNNYWLPPQIISAVRPDYLLYPEVERNAYYNANIAQFYHRNKLLKKKQPFENTKKHHKKTLVIDKGFWRASEENMETCMLELKEYKNIAFLHPIDLKILLNSEDLMTSFIELHFSQGTVFRFRNNYGQGYEDALKIFEFIERLKNANKHVKITEVPFKAVTTNHDEGIDAGLYDLERCLKIMDNAKSRKIHIRFFSPDNRLTTPFWYYFEMMEYWTLHLEKFSYVELMLNSGMKRTGLPWYGILNNKLK
ncbi:hypothetical protein DRO61_01140 [Candidatus Bathyarchaeota archaeon]|nr:MAG: hypothetical protein DRO61_01140 [Candidatus Bathyarchaeota archaeon]